MQVPLVRCGLVIVLLFSCVEDVVGWSWSDIGNSIKHGVQKQKDQQANLNRAKADARAVTDENNRVNQEANAAEAAIRRGDVNAGKEALERARGILPGVDNSIVRLNEMYNKAEGQRWGIGSVLSITIAYKDQIKNLHDSAVNERQRMATRIGTVYIELGRKLSQLAEANIRDGNTAARNYDESAYSNHAAKARDFAWNVRLAFNAMQAIKDHRASQVEATFDEVTRQLKGMHPFLQRTTSTTVPTITTERAIFHTTPRHHPAPPPPPRPRPNPNDQPARPVGGVDNGDGGDANLARMTFEQILAYARQKAQQGAYTVQATVLATLFI